MPEETITSNISRKILRAHLSVKPVKSREKGRFRRLASEVTLLNLEGFF